MEHFQAAIDAKEQQLAAKQSQVAGELQHMRALTDLLTADFTEAQFAISEKLSTALQDVERGQRSLHDEWVALFKQQEALGSREQRLQYIIVTRTSTQLSNKLNRLLLNAKQHYWRSWIVHTRQRVFKRFKLHAAAKLRCRFILAATFAQWRKSREPNTSGHDSWNSYMRLEVVNKFQDIQLDAADKEAQLLEQIREVRGLHIASAGREKQLLLETAQAQSEFEQEKKRADKLEQTMALQCAYIAQHERDSIELQQQIDALLAGKDECDKAHLLQLSSNAKVVEEKDRTILQLRQNIQSLELTLQQYQEQQQLLQQQLQEQQERVDAVKLEHVAAQERSLQYRRTEVLSRVVKRMRNMTVAAAFGAWVERVRDAREELLVASLEQLQNGIRMEQQLRDGHQNEQVILQQQLKEQQERVDAVKLEHVAAQERSLAAIDLLKQRCCSAHIELKDCEACGLLEPQQQFQTLHHHNPNNDFKHCIATRATVHASALTLSAGASRLSRQVRSESAACCFF